MIKFCDCETFPTYWMVGFMDEDETVTMFHLNEKINQISQFIDYMSQQDIYVGFNIIGYDAQLFEYIFKHPECTNADLFEESQRIIENSKGIPEWNLKHRYIDLYKVHHFDRFHVSLKWCEFGLDHDSLEDLPYKFNTQLTIPQMREVAMYNKNDLLATKKLFNYSSEAIDLREKISEQYNIKATNLSDSAIGRKIALNTYCDVSKKESKDVVKERTVRDRVLLKHCIAERIEFINPDLQKFLSNIKKSSLDILNREMKFEVRSKTYVYDMLKGGLHSKNSYNIVQSTDTHKIIDLDFGSFYPSIMVQLGIYPEHLGKDFLVGLDKLTKQRLQAKKDGNKAVALSLKLSINSIFGSLGDEYSWLRDEYALYRVTVNGQLLLLMLIDRLEQIGAQFFYANT